MSRRPQCVANAIVSTTPAHLGIEHQRRPTPSLCLAKDSNSCGVLSRDRPDGGHTRSAHVPQIRVLLAGRAFAAHAKRIDEIFWLSTEPAGHSRQARQASTEAAENIRITIPFPSGFLTVCRCTGDCDRLRTQEIGRAPIRGPNRSVPISCLRQALKKMAQRLLGNGEATRFLAQFPSPVRAV